MQPIKTLTHAEIQQELQESKRAVDGILKSLGVDAKVPLQQLHKLVLDDLKRMQFVIRVVRKLQFLNNFLMKIAFLQGLSPKKCKTVREPTGFPNKSIKYDRLLCNTHENQSVSGFMKFNTSNRTEGGVIMLNPDYSREAQFEALFHEYIHIKDTSLPIYSTNDAEDKSAEAKNRVNAYILPIYAKPDSSPDYNAMGDQYNQNFVEFQADMRTYTLIMPQEQIKESLLKNSYNIDTVLKRYEFMEKSSVLQWITINSDRPCHFAWVMFQKDSDNNIVQKLIHDSCYYDPPNDPQQFDILAVLDTPDSAAAKAAMASKRPQAVHQRSIIKRKEYYCYAYYELDQTKIVKNDSVTDFVPINFNRLLVIGWEKAVHGKR